MISQKMPKLLTVSNFVFLKWKYRNKERTVKRRTKSSQNWMLRRRLLLKMLTYQQSLYNVTNFIELPVLFVAHVIIDKFNPIYVSSSAICLQNTTT